MMYAYVIFKRNISYINVKYLNLEHLNIYLIFGNPPTEYVRLFFMYVSYYSLETLKFEY